MIVPLIVLSGLSHAIQSGQMPFTSPFVVADTIRLARTPIIDGKIAGEEWDQLHKEGSFTSYFQWEPGRFHLAGKAPADQDIVFSLDLNGDGFLEGADNLEVRLHQQAGKVTASVRRLDATKGVNWVDAEALQQTLQVAANVAEKEWSVECSLDDPAGWLGMKRSDKVGVRADAIPATSNANEGFSPRLMANLQLGFSRSAALPTSVFCSPDFGDSRQFTGEQMNVRLNFKGDVTADVKRLEIRNEFDYREWTTEISQPFPEFNGKGKTSVDYMTPIMSGMRQGYSVLRVEVKSKDGTPGIFQTSWRVAPKVDFDVVKSIVPFSLVTHRVDFTYYIENNTPNRLDGIMVVESPKDWKVIGGNDKTFIIYGGRKRIRRKFELEIPGGITGVYPIKLQAIIGARTVNHTEWVYIKPK